jgi:hypothetical protein
MAAGLLSGAAGVDVAEAAHWERSFAVDSFAPAAYYAGKAGTDEKADDCPKGVNPGVEVASAVTLTPWRTDAERRFMVEAATKELAAPQGGAAPQAAGPGAGLNGNAGLGGRLGGAGPRTSVAYRGFAPDINTYYNPMAAADPGMQEVTGKIALGFDLDGDPATGGFTSPDGVPGIDNSFYRALGCTYPIRGAPGKAYEIDFSNDHMRDGLQTMVIRISGNQDPLNDSDVVVELGSSPDDLVKDAHSGVSPDYSYQIDPSSDKYTRLNGKIVNGELFIDNIKESRTIDMAYMETLAMTPLVLYNAKLKIKFKADGSIEGLLGGYRKWPEYYLKDAWQQPLLTGNGRETFFHMDLIATYHALERNADGLPDSKGRMMGISTAYAFSAVSANVVNPSNPISYPGIDGAAERDRSIFLQIMAEGKIRRDDDPTIKAALIAARSAYGVGGPVSTPPRR